jgi:glutamine synthetase adenylyltransferase
MMCRAEASQGSQVAAACAWAPANRAWLYASVQPLHTARDWNAVRGFMAEQRSAIALALRYSGAADPEEPSAEARAEIETELSKALDALQRGLDAETFKRVSLLVIEMGKTGGGELPGPR